MFIVVLGKNNSPLKTRLVSQYITPETIIYCNHTRARYYTAPRTLDVGLEDYYKLNDELRQIGRAAEMAFDDVFYDGEFLKNSLNLLPDQTPVVLGISYPFEEIAAQTDIFIITNESEAIKKTAWEKWLYEVIDYEKYMKLFELFDGSVSAVQYNAHESSWTLL